MNANYSVSCNVDICPPGSSKTQIHFTQTDKQPADICLCDTTAIWNNLPKIITIKQQLPSSKWLIVLLMLAGTLPSLP